MPASGEEPRWRAGYRRLEARVRALPALLRAGAMLACEPPRLRPREVRGIVTTGIGSSAAHARLLAHLLVERLEIPARYAPASALLEAPPARAAEHALIVVSQGLSPNARLVLAGRDAWRHVVLMTASSEDGARRSGDEAAAQLLAELPGAGVEVRRFPAGEDEYGTLVRVIGPLAGYWCVLRFVEGLTSSGGTSARAPLDGALNAICAALAAAPERIARLDPPVDPGALASGLAFLTSGTYGELVENLRYKVLEGMLLPAPPVWDLLQVAHGPFQQAYDRPATFVALTRHDAVHEPELLARLGQMLDPTRHRVVRLAAALPGPLAIFEHEALMNELMLRYVAACGIDQADWPGRGNDVPLYALGGGRTPGADTPAVPPTPANHLEQLTWLELERVLAVGPRTAVIPLGATEQHGPHLPFATDTWIAEALAERFCTRVAEAIRCPTVAFGCSREHLAFPGTLDLDPRTLGALLIDLVTSLQHHGFACAFVFSAHGGNYAALRTALPALRAAAAPMQVIAFTDLEQLTGVLHQASAAFGVTPEASGHHAGEFETSILQGLRPGDVRTGALAPGFVEPHPDPQTLFYPSLRTHAPSGTVGDPRPAAASHAAAYLDAWVAVLVEAYRREKKSPYTSGT
jgi:creatinine amidohydrolase